MYNFNSLTGVESEFLVFWVVFLITMHKALPFKDRSDDPEIRKPCANRQARKEIRELEFDYRHFKRYISRDTHEVRVPGSDACSQLGPCSSG